MYRLVFLSGRYAGKRLVVRQAITLVGREADCHLLLTDDDQIAPRHARFEERGDGVHLTALDPGGHLECNGTPVVQELHLAHNDQLVLGQTRLQFQDIIAPHARFRPSPGLLQPATWLLATAILLFEVALLIFLVDWPRHIILPETEAADLARAEEIRAARTAEQAAATNGAARTSSPASIISLPGTTGAADAGAPSAGESLQVLQVADFAPADTNTLLAPLPMVSAADPRIEEAQRRLAEATAAAQFADYASAFRLLHQIHQSQPGFVPAHIEHARLLEARGDLDAAQQRWTQVLGIAEPGSAFHAQATAQRQRLADLRELQTRILQAEALPDLASLPRHVRILSPDTQKLPADTDIAEMRILAAALELAPNQRLFPDAVLQVFITFYDSAPDDRLRPTRAIVTPSPAVITGAFATRRSLPLEATYVVPRGLRAQEENEEGQPFSFYGFTIHVFAGQILQDAFAKPRKLLDLPIHFPTAEP
jgi:tetratricopeptide (TPR) repeat protein